MGGFWSNVAEKVDALLDKMDMVRLPLIIQMLKFTLELIKKVHPYQELVIWY